MDKQGNSATRAKNKYNTANYDQIKLWGNKGDRERFDAAAKKNGSNSRNAFILEAIEEKIKRLNEGE
ncbi:transcriptional regulator [Paenibacillus sp. UMB4589-SE434]|uniref:transcriptional regulator n=1 Tax=Paenibacillus sp. UMB4589-SE434 TaxID=3046314 RepID=UPI00254AFFD0|nr:transcriptional regulator [Paenibacillus sp. UMB4589-SE434]MDK8182138.1 transcriptional regulator [Paenibacillus sp. UMB4589-SE434]